MEPDFPFRYGRAFDTNPRTFRKVFLRQPRGDPFANQVAGNRRGREFHRRPIPGGVGLRQIGSFRQRLQPVVFGLFDDDVGFAVELNRLDAHQSVPVKPVAVSNLFDENPREVVCFINPELHAVVAGANSIMPGEIAR